MCGISGISVAPPLSVKPDVLSRSLSKLAHRGPDDSGVFEDHVQGIGMVHTRLSIIDRSLFGHQPMQTSDGSVTLIFNGEIYNYRELRVMLEERGAPFHGNSDTEVLLNLYIAYGEEMLNLLNGIFAFAIWDGKKEALFIARDAFGVKPLYYSTNDGSFAFSSEIKALLPLIDDVLELDLASLHRYLTFLWCPGEGTPIKSVHKMPPGGALWVKKGAIIREWNWYQLPLPKAVASLDLKCSLNGVVTHLRSAVMNQLVSDVPVGAFLSGGLDSSAVVAFAREENPDIHCFTIDSGATLEGGAVDDLPFARRAAKFLNVKLDVISVNSNQVAMDLSRMVEQLDEPIADPAALNVLYISQLARSQGIKVLLSGAGGDDLFTGYRRHLAYSFDKYWSWVPNKIKTSVEVLTSNSNHKNALFRRGHKLFSGASLNGDDRLINYFKWIDDARIKNLFTPDARDALRPDFISAKPMIDFLEKLPSTTKPLDRMLALEQRFFLADHNLNYTDKMSMAAGVEVRVPFLDLELVKFVAQIPLKFKQRGMQGKWILKKAMEPYLPNEIIYRPKSGFGVPLRKWILTDLREMVGDLLSVESLHRRGVFDPVAVQRLITSNNEGKIDASYTIFSLLCIEIWCRKFIDN
jgi:asparagine synthase (glutamine-hydrolysing)